MNADGSGAVRLTTGDDNDPAWSPDGRRIAFVRGDNVDDIHVMNADGSGPRPLITTYSDNPEPAWSPDGRRIAFGQGRRFHWENQEIYVMDADGSNVERLTESEGYDSGATWSPDGRRIAFQSDRDGNYEIYVITLPPHGSAAAAPAPRVRPPA